MDGHRCALLCAATLAVSLGACAPTPDAPDAPPPATASASGSSPVATPTSATPSAPATLDFTTGQPVLLPSAGEFGPAWEEVFALPYGDGEDQLGTSPGGEGLDWGPSYGTQLPDGTWWFLDVAHFRLAHFGEEGAYLGDAPLPEEHLANGEFFQWQSPSALADGTVVLQSTTPDRPALLRLSPDGTFTQVGMDAFVGVAATDGTLIYGFDEAGAPVSLDPTDGSITRADSFTGQDGQSYAVDLEPGSATIRLGALEISLPLIAADHPDSLVYPAVEAATGSDGVLTLLVSGIVEITPGEAVDAQALLRIDGSGRGTVEALPPLTSESDPGDGARLGVRLGDDRPTLMIIGADALRVYRRT